MSGHIVITNNRRRVTEHILISRTQVKRRMEVVKQVSLGESSFFINSNRYLLIDGPVILQTAVANGSRFVKIRFVFLRLFP